MRDSLSRTKNRKETSSRAKISSNYNVASPVEFSPESWSILRSRTSRQHAAGASCYNMVLWNSTEVSVCAPSMSSPDEHENHGLTRASISYLQTSRREVVAMIISEQRFNPLTAGGCLGTSFVAFHSPLRTVHHQIWHYSHCTRTPSVDSDPERTDHAAFEFPMHTSPMSCIAFT